MTDGNDAQWARILDDTWTSAKKTPQNMAALLVYERDSRNQRAAALRAMRARVAYTISRQVDLDRVPRGSSVGTPATLKAMRERLAHHDVHLREKGTRQ
jgi:hypothetical protein